MLGDDCGDEEEDGPDPAASAAHGSFAGFLAVAGRAAPDRRALAGSPAGEGSDLRHLGQHTATVRPAIAFMERKFLSSWPHRGSLPIKATIRLSSSRICCPTRREQAHRTSGLRRGRARDGAGWTAWSAGRVQLAQPGPWPLPKSAGRPWPADAGRCAWPCYTRRWLQHRSCRSFPAAPWPGC